MAEADILPYRASRSCGTTRLFVLALGSFVGLVESGAAQQTPASQDTTTIPWSAEVSLGANLSFGNVGWYFLTTGAEFMRVDSTTELALTGDYTYGEASDNQGNSFVNRRSWSVAASADYNHTSGLSPFAFATVESSLPARIDRRWIGGGGVKFAFRRGLGRRLDFSPALMVVRTTPGILNPTETHLRWSLRFRAIRDARSDPIKLGIRVYYQPRVEEMSRYLFRIVATFGVDLSEHVTLGVRFDDRYDTEAEERGARSNNDGRLNLELKIGVGAER